MGNIFIIIFCQWVITLNQCRSKEKQLTPTNSSTKQRQIVGGGRRKRKTNRIARGKRKHDSSRTASGPSKSRLVPAYPHKV